MEVLVLIVSFNGADTVLNAVESALTAAGNFSVLVVDNGSTDGTLPLLKSIRDSRLQTIPMEYNSGLGAAFNVGMRVACDKMATWLYVLDQDSVLAKGCLDRLYQTALELLKHGPSSVAAVSPTVRCMAYPQVIHYPLQWNGKQLQPEINGGASSVPGAVPVDSPISSGTLYRVAALMAIGGFNESYFIDFVDHDCHLRLKAAGFTIWWEKSAVMYHAGSGPFNG
jgi:rhamnosyltransferase